MRAYERFLRYIQFDTASSEASETCPSTPGQLVLGRALVKEMLEMGISDARMDEYGYVYGSIPATAPARPAIGLIAHMDTVDCVPVLPMNARIVENYDGGAVRLAGGDLLDPEDFPELKLRTGKDLIVTDGKTLLGADDKAGIAEILTACEARRAPRQGLHRLHAGRGDRPRRGPLRHFRLRRGLRLHRGRRRGGRRGV